MVSIIKKIQTVTIISLLTLILTLQAVVAATVEWSWDYDKGDPFSINIYFSSSSFDINVMITNDDTSDRAVYLAPYEIPEGFYYEGFYEFQSNIDEVVNTTIQPGETVLLNMGTWVPIFDGKAPYVNIEAQPKYLEVYYFNDNGDVLISGRESLNPMKLTIYDAINPIEYNPHNPGQGLIVYDMGLPGFQTVVPIPGSLWLFGSGLFILTYYRKRTSQ